MKNNLPISDHENDYSENIHIVSSTDLKGIITSCNEDFIEISGFSEDDLKGKNHNIVRHPDMPEAAFENLWSDLKANRSWMGIVKNRCKNGNYYWVDAYVTPVMDCDKIVGYQSVRVKPQTHIVERAKRLYKELNNGSGLWSNIKNKLSFGLMGKIISGLIVSMLPVIIVMMQNFSIINLGAILITVVLAIVISKLIAAPWQKAARESKKIFSNAVAQQVFTNRQDELGQLQLVIQSQEAQLRTIVYSLDEAASKLDKIAHTTANIVDETNDGISRQQSEIQQVATAMNEMTATVQEVALNTNDASTATHNAQELTQSGTSIAAESITSIMDMVSDAQQAAEVVGGLAEKVDTIGTVLDVIRGIAEQTNLLALNAAIEAARAGEHGRGFAVVADEVRTLASRTHQSTQEIQEMIESLQIEAKRAVDVMIKAQGSAEKNMALTKDMSGKLDEISGAVQVVNGMNIQIATAAEEQSAVSEEINRNIVNINVVSEQTCKASIETAAESIQLVQESEQLRAMVKQFTLNA